MPIDYQEIFIRIRKRSAGAKKEGEERRGEARATCYGPHSELDFLRSKVDSAKQTDVNIRCAYPLNETLASSHPAPDSVIQATLIAADGSQINPDRHAAIQFCVVNVGAIQMKLNSGETPEIFTDTELLYGDDLLPNGYPMSDGLVALKRDLAERTKLDELSKSLQGSVVTFTDGPIELWGAKGEDANSYEAIVQKYLGVLSLANARSSPRHVDKPSADRCAFAEIVSPRRQIINS